MVITKRCRNIILEIIKRESVKQSELAKIFKVSDRTIRSDIDEINYFLCENSFKPLYKNEKREIAFKTDENKLQLIYCLINQNDIVTGSYTKDERILELMYLLCLKKGPVKIDEIANHLNVSKSSVVKDLERLKATLKEDVVIVGGLDGIEISGDEISIRIALINVYFSMMDKQTINDLIRFIRNRDAKIAYKVFWHLFEDVDLKFVSYCIEVMKSRLSLHLSDYSYLYLTAAFALLLKRYTYMDKSNTEHVNASKFSQMMVSDIYDLIKKQTKLDIQDGEKDYLYYILIYMCKDIYIKENEDKLINLKLTAEQICEQMKKFDEYEIEMIQEDVKKEILYIAIEKQLAQKEYKNVIGLKDEAYLKVMQQVKDSWNKTEALFNMDDDDFWRIAWHFIAAKKCEKNIKKILIVSDKPKSLVQILVKKLHELFDIELLGITGIAQLDKYIEAYQIDYLISTLNLEGYHNVLKVHPLLQKSEIYYLKQHLDTHVLKTMKSNINVEHEYQEYYLKSRQDDMESILMLIDEKLQSEKVITHSLYEILKTNFIKTENDAFIYEGCLLLNIREHEIISFDCIVNVDLLKTIKCLEGVEQIKVIATNDASAYISYVCDFIK